MTCLPSSLPSTSRIITQGSGGLCLPACSTISGICLSIWFWFWINFLTLKFLTCSRWKTWPSCCFYVDRAEWPGSSQSRLLLKVADVPKGKVEKWKSGEAYQSFDTFKDFVKKITCVCQWLSACNNRLI
jgi:hypothetical protein